jgi:hypothetical protein
MKIQKLQRYKGAINPEMYRPAGACSHSFHQSSIDISALWAL